MMQTFHDARLQCSVLHACFVHTLSARQVMRCARGCKRGSAHVMTVSRSIKKCAASMLNLHVMQDMRSATLYSVLRAQLWHDIIIYQKHMVV